MNLDETEFEEHLKGDNSLRAFKFLVETY